MKAIKKIILAVAAVSAIGFASTASAVTFTVTGASFNEGNGYGEDSGASNNDLDVEFSTAAFTNLTLAQKTFNLNSVGESHTFNFGTVFLQETNIGNNEDEGLNVSASLTFSSPIFSSSVGPIKTITAAGVGTDTI
jgi:hypothetical protein